MLFDKFDFLEDDFVDIGGVRLNRIVANRAIRKHGVLPGDKGGYVEKSNNINQTGDAWVGGNALVFGDALIIGDALVTDDAICHEHCTISGNAKITGHAEVKGKTLVEDDAEVSDHAIVGARTVIRGNARVAGISLINHDLTISQGNFERLYSDDLADISKVIGSSHLAMWRQYEQWAAKCGMKKKSKADMAQAEYLQNLDQMISIRLRDTSHRTYEEIKSDRGNAVSGIEVRNYTPKELEKIKRDKEYAVALRKKNGRVGRHKPTEV